MSLVPDTCYDSDSCRVCGEKELNLALLRLVDYLGHPNSLICSLAYSEVCHIVKLH